LHLQNIGSENIEGEHGIRKHKKMEKIGIEGKICIVSEVREKRK
jgi:hypothetical protein